MKESKNLFSNSSKFNIIATAKRFPRDKRIICIYHFLKVWKNLSMSRQHAMQNIIHILFKLAMKYILQDVHIIEMKYSS